MSSIYSPEDCLSICAKLNDFVDDELDIEEQGTLERHLAVCSACRAELALLQLVVQSVRQMPCHAPDEEIHHRLLARMTRERGARRIERFHWKREKNLLIQRWEIRESGWGEKQPMQEAAFAPLVRRYVEWRWKKAACSTTFYQIVQAA